MIEEDCITENRYIRIDERSEVASVLAPPFIISYFLFIIWSYYE
jgi:hypothetical protein